MQAVSPALKCEKQQPDSSFRLSESGAVRGTIRLAAGCPAFQAQAAMPEPGSKLC